MDDREPLRSKTFAARRTNIDLSDLKTFWHKTLEIQKRQKLLLAAKTIDLSVLFKKAANLLVGLSDTYVDNTLQAESIG